MMGSAPGEIRAYVDPDTTGGRNILQFAAISAPDVNYSCPAGGSDEVVGGSVYFRLVNDFGLSVSRVIKICWLRPLGVSAR